MENEGSSEKVAVLIDGTSSAGKSMTANLLDAVPFYEATDPNHRMVGIGIWHKSLYMAVGIR